MSNLMSDSLIDVYPYCMTDDGVRFLIFRRTGAVMYAGQWRMIGGKVRDGESRAVAALRELKEETGCDTDLFWTVPSVNQFYDTASDTIHHIAAFAARLDRHAPIRLNHEHDHFQWIKIQDVKNFIKWPEQVRLIYLIHDILTGDGVMPEWLISEQ